MNCEGSAMNSPDERLEAVLRELDTGLGSFAEDKTGHKKVTHALRWLNSNITAEGLDSFIDTLGLTYADTIKALLKEPTFDPKAYS